jgi:hypothetical protein
MFFPIAYAVVGSLIVFMAYMCVRRAHDGHVATLVEIKAEIEDEGF